MNHDTNEQGNAARDEALFTAADFFLESFLSCWMRHERGYDITVSDGMGLNEEMYEVQIMTADGEFVCGEEGKTPARAIEYARLEMAKLPTYIANPKVALFDQVVEALRVTTAALELYTGNGCQDSDRLARYIKNFETKAIDNDAITAAARAVLAKVQA